MIAINWAGKASQLEANLVIKAQKLAGARWQRILSSRRNEGDGWRSAPFLWPLIDRS